MAKVKFTKTNQKRKELFPVDKKSKVNKQNSENGKKKKLTKVPANRTKSNIKEQSTVNISTVDKTNATHGLEFDKDDTRKVTFSKEQMENWKPLSEETFKNVARTIETAKQLILNRSHGLYYDSVKSAVDLSEKRVLASLKMLKVPHQHGQKTFQQITGAAAENLDQLELHECELEFRISKQKDACEKLQEELDKIEATMENSQMHPLLQKDFKTSLTLPAYKKWET